jgi:hypothetical protein
MSGDMIKFAELASPVNTSGKGTGEDSEDKNKPVELSESEKEVCKKLNLTEDEFRKYNK